MFIIAVVSYIVWLTNEFPQANDIFIEIRIISFSSTIEAESLPYGTSKINNI